jgi:alcohol dehydrogenase class IV
MAEVTIEQVADAMFELVKSTYGKKNLKPMDVTKAMIDQFGEDAVDKQKCKKALRQLIDSGRCTYKYAGGSYVTLPEN